MIIIDKGTKIITYHKMERKEDNEDTVTTIKFESSISVNPEFIKKEPALVYQDTPREDYGHGGSDINLDQIKTELSVEDITIGQKGDYLAGFQYFNSYVDNIKVQHFAKGNQSSEHVDDALLDSFKNEVKEEPNRENTHDTFDDSKLNECSLKIEIEEDEIKLKPHEEKEMNEKDFPQEDTLEIIKTTEVHSSNKEQHTSDTAKEKTFKCEICDICD
uniref:Uncharacterized protein LOC114347506 n=1 Tax=Diabrotica virgifera virgifera TaxID=50390 RepID=A0A6P7HE18_DIAVI